MSDYKLLRGPGGDDCVELCVLVLIRVKKNKSMRVYYQGKKYWLMESQLQCEMVRTPGGKHRITLTKAFAEKIMII